MDRDTAPNKVFVPDDTMSMQNRLGDGPTAGAIPHVKSISKYGDGIARVIKDTTATGADVGDTSIGTSYSGNKEVKTDEESAGHGPSTSSFQGMNFCQSWFSFICEVVDESCTSQIAKILNHLKHQRDAHRFS